MIVFVEGADGSGKTTLIKHFVETYGFKELKPPVRQEDKLKELEEWEDFVRDAQLKQGIYFVDRGPLSELVYRLVDTDKTYINDITALDNLFKRDFAVILCESFNAFSRAMERGEDNIIDKDLHNEIVRNYNFVAKIIKRFTSTPILKVDTYGKYYDLDILSFLADPNRTTRRSIYAI